MLSWCHHVVDAAGGDVPPTPIWAVIAYGPSRTPGASAMTLLGRETGTRVDYRRFQRRATPGDKLAGGTRRAQACHRTTTCPMSNATQSFRKFQAPTPIAPGAAPVQSRGSIVYVYGDASDTRRLQQHRQHRASVFPCQNYRRDADRATGPHGLPVGGERPLHQPIYERGGHGSPEGSRAQAPPHHTLAHRRRRDRTAGSPTETVPHGAASRRWHGR